MTFRHLTDDRGGLSSIVSSSGAISGAENKRQCGSEADCHQRSFANYLFDTAFDRAGFGACGATDVEGGSTEAVTEVLQIASYLVKHGSMIICRCRGIVGRVEPQTFTFVGLGRRRC